MLLKPLWMLPPHHFLPQFFGIRGQLGAAPAYTCVMPSKPEMSGQEEGGLPSDFTESWTDQAQN